MSIAFSSTTSKNGLIQLIERKCGFTDGMISGNTTRLAYFTADINAALDELTVLAIKASGTWQWDDSNQTDYPIVTTNIVSGQRDYAFTTDGSSNLILEIHRAFVANSAGIFSEIRAVDVETNLDIIGVTEPSGSLHTTGVSTFTDGRNSTGIPYRYDKLGNALFLDPVPNYNYTNGFKLYVSREGSYFVVSDTTKKAGIPGIFHELLAIIPSWKYAVDNNKANANGLLLQINDKKREFEAYYTRRDRDTKKRLIANVDSCE